ncbi:MAG TPA: peptidoglycan DD-metalloendopeptidase family protein [Dehalococcoidia bacterium]|nr:peptidoglycan DD-metalloendopeptidase family protein [Dehalococcoidia bacterium]
MFRLLVALGPLLLLAAVLACGGSQASAPTPTVIVEARATPTPTAIPTATPTATPEPSPTPAPTVEVAASFPQQGGFLLVRLLDPPPELSQATALFAGGSYAMLPEAGHWYALIGLGTDFPPGDYTVEVDGSDALGSTTVTVGPGGFAEEYVDLPPETAGLLSDVAAIEEEKRLLANVYAGLTPERLWSGAWLLPAAGPITNPFGLQRSINGGPFSPHTGTDIAADAGAPVAASATGRVAFAGALYLRGNSVVIDHGAGVFSGYHHLQSVAVAEGQAVNAGDLIGYVGATGLVSGPHLHWEAIVGGVRVDPTLWTYGPVEP